jgi:hypothetical protein
MYNLWQSYVTEKKAKMSMSGLRRFTYKEIKQATGGFKELLGRGGFGHVFKGELSYLEPPYVAVKKLIRSDEFVEKDFNNEVQSIGQIHHKNVGTAKKACIGCWCFSTCKEAPLPISSSGQRDDRAGAASLRLQ